MRTMFTDANTQQIVPVGNSNSLILTGFGSPVAKWVRMLLEVDEAAARTMAEEERRRGEQDAHRGSAPAPAPAKEEKPK
jgi:hypothetical protein